VIFVLNAKGFPASSRTVLFSKSFLIHISNSPYPAGYKKPFSEDSKIYFNFLSNSRLTHHHNPLLMRHPLALNKQQIAALAQAVYAMLPDADAAWLRGTASQGALAGEGVKIEL
jgi:hypothetical protein